MRWASSSTLVLGMSVLFWIPPISAQDADRATLDTEWPSLAANVVNELRARYPDLEALVVQNRDVPALMVTECASCWDFPTWIEELTDENIEEWEPDYFQGADGEVLTLEVSDSATCTDNCCRLDVDRDALSPNAVYLTRLCAVEEDGQWRISRLDLLRENPLVSPSPACIGVTEHESISFGELQFARYGRSGYPASVQVWPYGQNILVAGTTSDNRAEGADSVWLVNCSDPSVAVRPRFQVDIADFSNAVRARDEERFYFSSPYGVGAYEVESEIVRIISTPPILTEDECYSDRLARDFVIDISPDERTLVIDRGGPCSPDHAAWELDTHWLPLAADGSASGPAVRIQPVYDVAGGNGGTLWVANGDLFRSDDGGNTFTQVEVSDPAYDEELPGPANLMPVMSVRVDATEAGRILVYRGLVSLDYIENYGELWYASTDNGESWRAVEEPEAAWVIGLVADAGDPPLDREHQITHGGTQFRASANGLLRRSDDFDEWEMIHPM